MDNARIKVLQIAKHNIESRLPGTEKQYKTAKFNYQKAIEQNSPGNIKASLLINYENAAAGLKRLQELIYAASEMLEQEKGKTK